MFVSLHLLTFSPWFKWVHKLILPSTEQKREKCIILLCNYSYIFYIVTLAISKTKQGREARVFMRVTSAGSKNLCSVSNSELVHHLFHLKKKIIFTNDFLTFLIRFFLDLHFDSLPTFWTGLTMQNHWEQKWSKGGFTSLSCIVLTGNIWRFSGP